VVRRDADTGVQDGDRDVIAIGLSRTHHERSAPVGHGRHRLDRVHRQIEDDLLQPDAITDYRRQA